MGLHKIYLIISTKTYIFLNSTFVAMLKLKPTIKYFKFTLLTIATHGILRNVFHMLKITLKIQFSPSPILALHVPYICTFVAYITSITFYLLNQYLHHVVE